MGHTLLILLVGGAIIVFSLVVPARLGLSLELAVAVMLVVLGALNLVSFLRGRAIQEPHTHDHDHGHALEPGRLRSWRPLLVGGIHGLAGSAAVALLMLATIHQPLWAMLYLLLFGVGTVVGMMLITTAMAAPLTLTTRRFKAMHRHLAWVSGLLSVGFGLFLVYEIGFVNGLFTGDPHWDPH